MPTIVGELKRHFRDNGWGMRLPRSMQERNLEVNDAMTRLATELGRSPTARDVALDTRLPLEDVAEALAAAPAYSPASLDGPYGSEDDCAPWTLGDSLGTEDPGYGRVELAQAVAPAFRSLPAREQAILRLRFVDDLTQSEIAERHVADARLPALAARARPAARRGGWGSRATSLVHDRRPSRFDPAPRRTGS